MQKTPHLIKDKSEEKARKLEIKYYNIDLNYYNHYNYLKKFRKYMNIVNI